MKKFLYLFFILPFLFCTESSAQSGIGFNEFSKKLEPYFANELIEDIKEALPDKASYQIWGWDVGDFSGDSYYDLAFAVKMLRDKNKIMQVYMFVDNDGFMTKVGQLPFEYFELPLEIGVAIKNNTCFIMQKHQQFDWTVKGYNFNNGNLTLLNDFDTYRNNQYTIENTRDYDDCVTSEKYINTKNNTTAFLSQFVTVPCYERGKTVYKGYANSISTMFPEFVYQGAFYYTGDDDANFSIRSNYDSDNLYFSINITDDKVIPTRCDSCLGDFVELWFDFYPLATDKDRLLEDTQKNPVTPRNTASKYIYSISISPGDFLEIPPFVKCVKSTDSVTDEQKLSVKKIRSVSSLTKSGYNLKIKIPFEVFGYNPAPAEGATDSKSIGFTFVIDDVDNEFRPEEISKLATSEFDNTKPCTFGELKLIPKDKWYGQSQNVFHDNIIEVLNNFGF